MNPKSMETKWAGLLALDGTQLSRLEPKWQGKGLGERCQRSLVQTIAVQISPNVKGLYGDLSFGNVAPPTVYNCLKMAMQAAVSRWVESNLLPKDLTQGQPSRPITPEDLDEALKAIADAVEALPKG